MTTYYWLSLLYQIIPLIPVIIIGFSIAQISNRKKDTNGNKLPLTFIDILAWLIVISCVVVVLFVGFVFASCLLK